MKWAEWSRSVKLGSALCMDEKKEAWTQIILPKITQLNKKWTTIRLKHVKLITLDFLTSKMPI